MRRKSHPSYEAEVCPLGVNDVKVERMSDTFVLLFFDGKAALGGLGLGMAVVASRS